VASSLGILAASARLHLSRAGISSPFSSTTLPTLLPWGWQFLGDLTGYASWALLGLALSARSGLVGVLLSKGGNLAEWRQVFKYGLSLGIPLAALSWLGHRLGIEIAPWPKATLSHRDAMLVAAQAALHGEIIARLGLLSLSIWLLGVLFRHRDPLAGSEPARGLQAVRVDWPSVLGIALSTLLWRVVYPTESPWLATLLGLTLGYAFVQAGWEATFLAHFIFAVVAVF